MHFIDLKAQQARISNEINTKIQAVLSHGQYILGPEVAELEQRLAKFSNAEYGIGCANGTDALTLVMMAWGIGPGDAVFCPSFTYCATAEAIALIGATPVFVDVRPDTYNMCAQSLDAAITDIKQRTELNAKAIITVDIFGQSADYPALRPIAQKHNLRIIADTAQSFGSTLNGHHPIHWADAMTTSFFPAKPLGCYGDGGAIFTQDGTDFDLITSLRFHGKGEKKYENIRIGKNSRLDSLQAAILLAKFEIFEDEITARNEIATRYINALKGKVYQLPFIKEGIISTWAQFTLQVENPDDLSKKLQQDGIPTARYYPIPIHLQKPYKDYPCSPDKLSNTLDLMNRVISLPMHPYLTPNDQDRIIERLLHHLR